MSFPEGSIGADEERGRNNFLPEVKQVVNKICEIDFNNTDDKHTFGAMYEQILKDLQSSGNAGEFYTPRAVTKFIVNRVDPKLNESVLDPACGTGGFLVAALDEAKKKSKNDKKFENFNFFFQS